MKRFLTSALFAVLCIAAAAGNQPRWLRQSNISPDGKTIAFAWQGDIFTVPVSGGQALQVTSNPAYETAPVWSPDGSELVFSSFREYTFDIWKISAKGGVPTRLTAYAGAETPLCVTRDGNVIFSANIQPDAAYGDFPGRPQVWSVPLAGGAPKLVTSLPMLSVSVNDAGVILYEDYKGVEDSFRKHHTSSVTRDVWSLRDGVFTKLSTYIGENRNPVFAADGQTFYFLRENVKDDPNAPDACFNVWKSTLDNPSVQTQVTFFKTHPVRYLSVSLDGTLLFSWNGDLYTCRDGAAPAKVAISVMHDENERDTYFSTASSGISSAAVSPNGKEVAVTARGEVFVSSVEAKTTRRITCTDVQERGVTFSGDGRSVYYASERDGEWGIWKSTLADKDDKFLSLAWNFKEERVTPEGQTCFQPLVSPDGKWLAYLRDRTELVIRSTSGKEEKSLLKGVNYSYTDGDLDFEWSPDSRYILCTCQEKGGWNNSDVAVIEVKTGEVTNLTRSGYSDGTFHWTIGGKAMTWASDKAGYRSHGSWGADKDVYVMFFDGKAYADFTKSKDEEDIEKMLKSSDKKAAAKEEKEKKDSTKTEKKAEKLVLDFDGRDDRTMRLTKTSGRMGDHYLAEDGSKLYYASDGDLCSLDMKDKSFKVVKKGFSGIFITSPDRKNVFVVTGSGVQKFDPKAGSTKPVSFSGEYSFRPAAEREYIFEHCWKQVSEKFYDPAIHGVDWQAMHDNYKQFLPYIKDNYDFQELLSEMLGELNGSHTGARYRRLVLFAPATFRIGVLFDQSWEGKGLKIAEMLPGGLLGNIAPEVEAGDVIVAINGSEIEAGTPWYEPFTIHSLQRMQLTVKKAKGGKTLQVWVKPSGNDSVARYHRWVRQREEMVEKLSGGRVGYVHVQGMNSQSFREVYSKALGKYRGCEALIVDTRHNGGGWLHDDLASFLNGKAYIEYRPRGQYIGTDPYSKWNKPSCVLIGEDNYSDACGFPYVYKTLGIGKLIGAPVPGTMTAVWWETQVDGSLVFGIPQVTSWGLKEGRPLENFQIEPDILVYNDPASVLRGEDKQLEAAVAEMLKTIGEAK